MSGTCCDITADTDYIPEVDRPLPVTHRPQLNSQLFFFVFFQKVVGGLTIVIKIKLRYQGLFVLVPMRQK